MQAELLLHLVSPQSPSMGLSVKHFIGFENPPIDNLKFSLNTSLFSFSGLFLFLTRFLYNIIFSSCTESKCLWATNYIFTSNFLITLWRNGLHNHVHFYSYLNFWELKSIKERFLGQIREDETNHLSNWMCCRWTGTSFFETVIGRCWNEYEAKWVVNFLSTGLTTFRWSQHTLFKVLVSYKCLHTDMRWICCPTSSKVLFSPFRWQIWKVKQLKQPALFHGTALSICGRAAFTRNKNVTASPVL